MALNITRITSVEYLQSTVMVGDTQQGTSMTGRGLTAYYTESGNPPGRWYGTGLPGLSVTSGEAISSDDAVAVWQKFRNPRTGERLGKPPRAERRQTEDANDNQLADSSKQDRRDVAGFDLTFTIPKDASILWALGDPELQVQIASCHERALHATLDHLEDTVLQSRAGHGGVAAVAVRGLIAGQWDHWDTREGEPHLHSHVVVSNRVQRAVDGKWVTIDSRSLYRATVALSEIHQNLFMDELHRELGVEWTEREGVTSRAAVPDIVGMPSDVRELFSSRAAAIDRDLAQRIERFREQYDREPTHRELLDLKQQAWRATRKPKDKEVKPLSERCEQWRELAEESGQDPSQIIAGCVDRNRDVELIGDVSATVHDVLVALTIDSLGTPTLAEGADVEDDQERRLLDVSAQVLDSLEGTRSTWTAANARAEVERITRMVRASSPDVRHAAIEQITESVLELSVQLTPTRYRVDAEDARIALRGRSVFDDLHRIQFTSLGTLDREQTLVDALRTPGAVPTPDREDVQRLVDSYSQAQKTRRGYGLAEDQDEAARAILAADTTASVLVGPAGTGKTTTMAAVTEVWQQLHAPGSVVGLATSAQAASVLSDDTGTQAHTIAKWLHESTTGQRERADRIRERTGLLHSLLPHEHHRAEALRRQISQDAAATDAWRMRAGQLFIVDEASMTSTVHLHELTRQADAAGARILMVGDHRQLDAIGAGGALALLAAQPEALELTSVWRFRAAWEKATSLELRSVCDEDRALSLIDTYDEHDRIHHGDDEEMGDAAFEATHAALNKGRSAIVIAATNSVVADLNERFAHARRASGEVDARRTVTLRGHADAGIGERILTRRNDRTMRDTEGDFIRNGSTLTVEAIHNDGSITARRDTTDATIRLPAEYLLAHTELGYATTAHRSQGITVDESRLYLPTTDSIPSELLYVGLTRGRDLNAAYIGQEDPEDPEERQNRPGHLVAAPEVPTWKGRLAGMMTTIGAEQSALATRDRIDREADALGRLRSEYEYLTSLEDTTPLVHDLAAHHGLDPTVVEDSPVLSSLAAAYRTAHAVRPEPARHALTAPLTGLADADEDERLRVLTSRLRAYAPALPTPGSGMVAGLTAKYSGEDAPVADLAEQVQRRIQHRIEHLAATAPSEPWATGFTPDQALHVGIYRDLYDVREEDTPLGEIPEERDTRRRAHYDALVKLLDAAPDQPEPVPFSGPVPEPHRGPAGPR